MMELLFIFVVIALFGALLIGLLKALVFLVVLPFKVAIWMAQGIIGLVLIIPLAIISFLVLASALPVIGLVLALPVLLFAGIVALLARIIC